MKNTFQKRRRGIHTDQTGEAEKEQRKDLPAASRSVSVCCTFLYYLLPIL